MRFRFVVLTLLAFGCSRRSVDVQDASSPVASVAVVAAKPDASPSRADAGPRKFTADEMRRYDDALKRGRALTIQKKFADAVASFNAALDVIPNDARATSERGYASFLSGDVTHAEKDFWRALREAPIADKKLRAQIYFNLGLVNEKQGDEDEAQSDFRSSYEYNPTPQAKAKMSACPAIISSLTTTPYANQAAAIAALATDTPDPNSHIACASDGSGCYALLPIGSGVVAVGGVPTDRCVGLDPGDCSNVDEGTAYWTIEIRAGECSGPICGCVGSGTCDPGVDCASTCDDAGVICGASTCAHFQPHGQMWIDAKTGTGLWSVSWDPEFIGKITASVTKDVLTVTGAGCDIHRALPVK